MSVRWKLHDGGTFTGPRCSSAWSLGLRVWSVPDLHPHHPPAEVRSESWPHRGAATAASERREPGREEERPQRCSGAEPSQAVSPVRGADRCDVTAQSAARTPSSFREAPFRINVADVTEPRQETFLEADMKQLFMFTRPERIIAIRLSDKCRKTERINILKKMNICALSQ